jgi:phage major head subunit gpT-like protein
MMSMTEFQNLIVPGIRGEFFAAYARRSQDAVYPQIATVVRGDSNYLDFGWLGNVPRLREWVGPRQLRELSTSQNFRVYTKTFEGSLSIPRAAIEDQQLEMIMPRVRDLANEAVRHREEWVVQTLAQGTTLTTFDGQPLLANRGGPNNNLTSNALGTDSLQQAISAMMQFVDNQGVPFGVIPDTLLVGPKLMWKARELLESPVVVQASGGASPYKNVLQGTLKLIVSPYLTGAYDDYWFVLDTSREMRAVGVYERTDVPIELTVLSDPQNSDYVFLHDEVLVGVRKREAVFPGAWFTVYGGIL